MRLHSFRLADFTLLCHPDLVEGSPSGHQELRYFSPSTQIHLGMASVPDAMGDLPPIQRARIEAKNHHLAGRELALHLLHAQNVPCETIPRGERGNPLWPSGWCGSISHNSGLCAVAIASTARYRGIGLDIEKINRVVPSTWPTILHPTELRQLRTLPEPEQTAFAARIFSAKEAVYKALAPLCAPEELPGFQTSLIHFKEDRFSLECENQRFLQNVSGWTGSVTDFVVNLVFLRAWRK